MNTSFTTEYKIEIDDIIMNYEDFQSNLNIDVGGYSTEVSSAEFPFMSIETPEE